MSAFYEYPGAFDEVVDSPPTEQQDADRYERLGTTLADHPARNGSEQATDPLPFFNASSWQNEPIPPRRWLVPARIPMSNVTLLQGDGAAGKTTIALQLCVAVACGLDWLGALIDEPGASMFFSGEEDEDELHRRVADIVEHRHLTFRELGAVHLLGAPSEDVTLAGLAHGVIRPTRMFNRLEQAVLDIRPKLLVIEAAADVFGGNENDRGHVRQGLGLLRRLGKKADTAVVLLQHPSLNGITTGTGNSGSTHWSNGVRSRLYFSKPKSDETDHTSLRQLEVMKANYGPSGEVVRLRWRKGVFVLDAGASEIECAEREDIFLQCLRQRRRQGIEVVPTPGRGYAPREFERMPEAKGLTKKALADAMERLLSANRIKVAVIGGPPSKQKRALIEVRSEE
jgi:RecA-family ATPase